MSPEQVLEKSVREQSLDDELKAYEQQLRKELGLEDERREHFVRPEERRFARNSRETTTILFGGLTLAHEELIRDCMQGLGYKIEPLPCPDNDALTLGKEFGNRGQCNPTYYTVGNLVKFLQKLRDEEGMSVADIKDRYVFMTAGACGPCRFGMYEAEYRKAMRDSGFEGFRVLLFEQTKGISQAAGDEAADEGGIDFNRDFFIGIIQAIMLGDLINDLGYQIRPYEVESGRTDRVIDEAKRFCGETLRDSKKVVPALKQVRQMFEAIPCDFTRVKPVVKITGEFWAMTTEGDGNYKMGSWLESEGAQVLVEPVSTWVDYLLYTAKHDMRSTYGVADPATGKTSRFKTLKTYVLTSLLKAYFRRTYDKYRKALGMKPLALPDQGKIHRYAQDYYNIDLRGGEGHMEIGKNIYAVLEKKAHMVISVKPFGCMPSTQSDGVQSKVVNDYPDCIFIPIETSGDGEVNVKSRVQMKLYEAKVRCREEFKRALEAWDLTEEEFRQAAGREKGYAYSLLTLPHEEVGVAANLVHVIGRKLKHRHGDVDAPKMSIAEVEKVAREEAIAEHAACVEEEGPAELRQDSCGAEAEGCPTCSDSLPGEQKARSLEATVGASQESDCGRGSCGCN